MSNYLVTGAAGFIGSRTSEMLIEQGHTVTGVDNLNDAYDVRIKEYRLQKIQNLPGFKFFNLDITDRAAVFSRLSSYDSVVNLAARAGVRASVENPWAFLEVNIIGALNILELCRQRGILKFIQASTSSVYGADASFPTSETSPSNEPLQPYAASKKGIEVLAHTYKHLYDIDVTIFRFFTVYGPAGRPDMVLFRLVQWIEDGRPVHIFGDGEQSRGFTYVDDIVQGIILGTKPVGYEIVNLGGHEVITINKLINLVEEMVGKKANVIYHPADPADMFSNCADVTKAKNLLGWSPKVNMREGVKNLVDWYRSEWSWASDIKTW